MQGPDEMRTALRSVLTKGAGDMTTQALGGTAETLNKIAGGSASAVVATVAVGATLEALRLGYESIDAHTQASHDAYSLFVQDYSTGTVSVFLPTDPSVRTPREQFFASFLELFQVHAGDKNSPLFRYAGIRYTEKVDITIPSKIPGFGSTKRQGTRYSLISMPTLVFAGGSDYARSGDPLLDIALRGSDLFLRARLQHKLAAIFAYDSPNVLAGLTEHTWTTRKLSPEVIHELDLVRFMVIAFANLLTNLQHPSDLNPATNIPLSNEETIRLCGTVIALMNTILLPKKVDNKLAYLQSIYCKDVFDDFIRRAKREAEELQEGYQSKKLQQLNLMEVIAQSHGILQVLSTVLHQILYLDSPMTESKQLLYLVRSLSNALDDHPDFWRDLSLLYTKKGKALPVIPGLNQPYSTVIDLIGLFASFSTKQRDKLLTKMRNQTIAPTICEALFELDMFFIKPLANDLSTGGEHSARSFLMNLIALSVESQPVFLQEAIAPVPGVPTLRQQFAVINNAQILVSTQVPVFTWDWLNSLTEQTAGGVSHSRTPQKDKHKHLLPQTIQDFKAYLKAKYEFLDALRSVSELQEVLENNKTLLIQKHFRNMLKKVLLSLDGKINGLSQAIQQLSDQVTNRDKIDDQEKDEISNQRRLFIQQMRDANQLISRIQLVKRDIAAATDILDSAVFVKKMEIKFDEDMATVYASYEEFSAAKIRLLAALQLPASRRQSSAGLSAKLPDGSGSTHTLVRAETSTTDDGGNNHLLDDQSDQDEPLSSSSALQLQFVLRILRWVSTFFLIVGVLVLLSLTLGASYLPVIAALSSQQLTAGMVAGGMSAFVGGVGLGFSCFFKPATEQGVSSGTGAGMELRRGLN